MYGKQGTASKGGILRELRLIARQGRQVWKLVPRRHKLAFGGAGLVLALTSACNTALPILLGKLVDGVQGNVYPGWTVRATATYFLVFLAGVYLLREGLNVLRRHLVESSCTRLEKVLTIKLVSHLMKVDLAALSQEKVGALQGRINRSVVGFVRFLKLSFLDLLPPLATGGFALIYAVSKQPWLALAMTGVIPLSVFLTIRQIVSQKGVRLKLIRNREEMEGTVVELLGGMDYVRAANTHHYEVARVARAAEKRRAREIKHHFQMSLFGCAKALNEGFFHILVLALAIHLALNGTISFGDIFMFSILFWNVMAPLNEVHRGLDEGHECSLQVADLMDMLSEPVDRSFSPRRVQEPRLQTGQPVIVVEDLRVDYPTSNGVPRRALDGVSVTIHHGETIGVVGRSGSGKSTWLRVMLRLTHPTEGKVLLGEVPIEEVSRDAIGHLVGYVSQHPFVFEGAIAENIAYGMENATEEDIRRAAQAAFIHEEILMMPGGYDAPVRERGLNLSGGQRQRLALARIFLKNPPILILDEGTSALDTINERNVQRAIDAARADRTVILVAHRLTTLRDADRILVFDAGRIIETGTFSSLLCAGGKFTQLAQHAGHPIVPAENPVPDSPLPLQVGMMMTQAG